MRIYLAGPMRGIEDLNFPLFDRAAAGLRKQGHEVFNPVELTRELYGSLENLLARSPEARREADRVLMAKDLWWLCHFADAVYFLPGWLYSKGSRAEQATAIALDIPRHMVPDVILKGDGHEYDGVEQEEVYVEFQQAEGIRDLSSTVSRDDDPEELGL